MVGDGSCVGDGGGAAAGLVGECAAGRALTQSQRKRRTGQTADGGHRSERIFEDRGEGLRDEADVDDDDAECADNIDQAHGRGDLFAELADALDAADQDDAADGSGGDCHDPGGNMEGALQRSRHGIGLRKGCSAETAEDDGNGEEDRQRLPLLTHAALDVVHRAAVVDAVFTLDAVVLAEGDLDALGHHAEQGDDPHPEHSARAADDHCRRDARNICGADTAGQRGADGLQRSERALVTGSTAALFEHFTGSVFQNISHFADLEELCADAVQQTDNAQKDQYGCAPEDVAKSS